MTYLRFTSSKNSNFIPNKPLVKITPLYVMQHARLTMRNLSSLVHLLFVQGSPYTRGLNFENCHDRYDDEDSSDLHLNLRPHTGSRGDKVESGTVKQNRKYST